MNQRGIAFGTAKVIAAIVLLTCTDVQADEGGTEQPSLVLIAPAVRVRGGDYGCEESGNGSSAGVGADAPNGPRHARGGPAAGHQPQHGAPVSRSAHLVGVAGAIALTAARTLPPATRSRRRPGFPRRSRADWTRSSTRLTASIALSRSTTALSRVLCASWVPRMRRPRWLPTRGCTVQPRLLVLECAWSRL